MEAKFDTGFGVTGGGTGVVTGTAVGPIFNGSYGGFNGSNGSNGKMGSTGDGANGSGSGPGAP